MRMIVFFDLPTTSAHDRKVYVDFRKRLIKEGFVMMQQSVYTKLVLNPSAMQLAKERISRIVPTDGLVQMLAITENQFAAIDYMAGEPGDEAIQSTERMVIL